MPERIFGTDGIRGRAGQGWLTTDAVSSLGRAVARTLVRGRMPSTNGQPRRDAQLRALTGHDGRRSGPELEAALTRGLVTEGFGVTSAGLITTPGLALLARLEGFACATMISASHNPAEDNGIKIFSSSGEKLSDEDELAIEDLLRVGIDPVRHGPRPSLDPDLEQAYLTYLVETVGRDLALHGLSIALDCANGGASRVAPRVLERLGAKVRVIAAEPDGTNINLHCGATHPGPLQQVVVSHRANLGIALDGDGDRCVLVDERGDLVHGDGILTVIAHHGVATGELRDPRVVATVMSNRGLHRALREVGVSVVTVGVGDRRVVEELRREGLQLGGEQSGHVVFGDENFHIGDGIFTALRVLRVMRRTGKPLSALAAPYQPFPQVLLNVPVVRKPSLDDLPRVSDAVRRLEADLGEDGRVLLRYSGTEPVARVMVEGPDAQAIRARAQEIADLLVEDIRRADIGA